MTIIHHPSVLRSYIQHFKDKQRLIGFVPTMGALHDGHLSLISESKAQNDLTVCSIFVNPTQFNQRADFEKYPHLISADIRLLECAGNDVLFLPDVKDIYPDGTKNLEHYDLGDMDSVLEGAFRPGHFQGVCQVMSRLLKTVMPDNLYMGQKDYQQCMVVNRLIELISSDAKLITCATRREADGLAMSSRNLRLTKIQRDQASQIYKSMLAARESIRAGDLHVVKAKGAASLKSNGFRVDYFEIADATTLQLLDFWDGNSPVVILVAAFLGEVRLIDNMVVAPL